MFESLEQLQESSSDEEEFFDAKGEFLLWTWHSYHPHDNEVHALGFFLFKVVSMLMLLLCPCMYFVACIIVL